MLRVPNTGNKKVDENSSIEYNTYRDATSLVWSGVVNQDLNVNRKLDAEIDLARRLRNLEGIQLGNRVYRRIVERYKEVN